MFPLIHTPGGRVCMIQLTRLNNTRLAVNSDLIKYVEQAPDTVITLLNGEKLVVRETTEQVIERVLDFRRSVLTASSETVPRPSACLDPASATGEGPVHG
jgi:flagellar protein FlbD